MLLLETSELKNDKDMDDDNTIVDTGPSSQWNLSTNLGFSSINCVVYVYFNRNRKILDVEVMNLLCKAVI